MFPKFLRFLWETMRWKMVAAVVLSVLLSLTEGVSLALIFPLLAVLGGGGHPGGFAGRGTARLLHLLALTHLPERGWLPAMLLLLVAAVWALASLAGALSALELDLILGVREKTASRLYRAMLGADWGFLSSRRSAGLTHLLTGELHRVGTLGGAVVSVFAAGLVALLMVGVALYLSPGLTLGIALAFAALIPWQRRVGRAINAAGKSISVLSEEVMNSSVERLQHLKVIKAYGAQAQEGATFDARLGALTREMTGMEWRGIAASRHFQAISMLLLCGVILLGLGPLHLQASAMLIFLFAFLRMSPRLNVVQTKVNSILGDLPAYGRIEEFLIECGRNREQVEGVLAAPSLERELILKGIRFGYSAGAGDVLRGLDMKVHAGQVTGVMGDSGQGKSTLADLLMGLLVAQAGTISVDGVALTAANMHAWRGRVGYVSQDTLLFHESIRQNLLWAKRDASEEELAAAIEQANAQFCYTLPAGLDTLAGDRGTLLSHGQRQRIALARALLLKPALLILDEATNSLDIENEAAILSTVRARGHALTTLLISHRPSALLFADVIYKLDGGLLAGAPEFAESGPQERLRK